MGWVDFSPFCDCYVGSTVNMTSCLHIGLLCIAVVHLVEGPPTCTDVDGKPQYFDGTQCKPCPTCRSGYGLSEICGNGQGIDAFCRECPFGHFSDDDSMEMCRSCRICSNTMEDAVPCTSTSDRKCGKCKCGYFRYQERDDQCARCVDENYSDLYDECLLQCPTPPSTQEPVNIVTAQEPSERPTSLDPVVIIVIVVLGLGLIVTIVVICLWRKSLRRCLIGSSQPGYSPVVQIATITHENLPTAEDEGTTASDCPNINREALQKEPDKPTCVEVSKDESQIRPQKDVDIGCPEVISSSMQGAVPFFDNEEGPSEVTHAVPTNESGSGDQAGNSDAASGDSNSHFESKSQGSRDSGTQTEFQTANQDAEFDRKLKLALVGTKDIELEFMHREDIDLLNLMLYEKPELMKDSKMFHYGRMAELFDLNAHEIRQLNNAEQVLVFVVARRRERFTVADFLDKLEKSGKCYDVVSGLVDQIVKRL